MTTREASWKASWKSWFAGQEGIEARSILENGLRRNMPAVPRGGDTASELRRITNSDRNTAEAELRARLESLTIEQLRGYVVCQVQDLKTESNSWDDKREAGWRKVTTGAQDFVEAADSFLAGFAGVVEVANLADTQFGGAASLVLALFFATIKLKALTPGTPCPPPPLSATWAAVRSTPNPLDSTAKIYLYLTNLDAG